MSKKLKELNPGEIVYLFEGDVKVPFIFLEYNHYGNEECTLLRKYVKHAVPYNLCTNSTYITNSYSAKYLDIFLETIYTESLSPIIKGALISVPIMMNIGFDYYFSSSSYSVSTESNTIKRRCFSLSARELGHVYTTTSKIPKESFNKPFEYFASNEKANRIVRLEGSEVAVPWWTRTPYNISMATSSSYRTNATRVSTDGSFSAGSVDNTNVYFARPALALSSEVLVSDYPDDSGIYEITDMVVSGMAYQKINGTWRRLC